MQIVAGTVTKKDSAVKTYNREIHKELFGTPWIAEGEMIKFYSSYQINDRESIDNSSVGFVKKILGEEERTYEKTGIYFKVIKLLVEIDGKDRIIETISKNDADKYGESKNYEKFESVLKMIANGAEEETGQNRNKLWRKYWALHDSYAYIEFGYAVTTHKAQGSTYDVVAVDESDIRTHWGNQEAAELIYTAVTRSSNVTMMIQPQTSSQNTPDIQQLNETINSNKNRAANAYASLIRDLGADVQSVSETQDSIAFARKGRRLEEFLEGVEPFFTEDEIKEIKKGLGDKKLHIESVHRLTDAVLFSKDVISFLEQNGRKELSDPTRVNAIELWSKHDGLPMIDILEACIKYRVAPMVSISITGLGNTAIEKGVLNYKDMLQKVKELVEKGILNSAVTTIRIDPIIVGLTDMNVIKDIVETAKSFGIRKFVTSLMQSYGYTADENGNGGRKVIQGINEALAKEKRSYDWEEYYGRITQQDVNESNAFARQYEIEHPEIKEMDLKQRFNTLTAEGMKRHVRFVLKNNIGKYHFVPKFEYIDKIGNFLLELDKDPEITIQTCSFNITGLEVSACLDPLIIERVVGIDVMNPDGEYDRETSRPECMCYANHSNLPLLNDKECFSSCSYCYSAHSGDDPFVYYDENGKLIDNEYTQTREFDPSVLEQIGKQRYYSRSQYKTSDSYELEPQTRIQSGNQTRYQRQGN